MNDVAGPGKLKRLREKTARINAKAGFASLADQGLRAKTEALRKRSAEEQDDGQLRALPRHPSPTDE
jgi:preprotein translocase subunit SecA